MKSPLKNTEPINKKKILALYHRREERNYHSENAIMLIKLFGTKAELKKAKELKKKHKEQGYLTWEQSNWFSKHGHKHYDKLIN